MSLLSTIQLPTGQITCILFIQCKKVRRYLYFNLLATMNWEWNRRVSASVAPGRTKVCFLQRYSDVFSKLIVEGPKEVGCVMTAVLGHWLFILFSTTAGSLVRSACPWRHIHFFIKVPENGNALDSSRRTVQLKRELVTKLQEIVASKNLDTKDIFELRHIKGWVI